MIYIAETRPKKFKLGSWLIRKFEGTDFSHNAILWRSDTFGLPIIYEAYMTKVGFIGPDIFLQRNEIVNIYSIDVPKENIKHAIRYLILNDGKKYGYWSLLGFIPSRLFKMKNPFRDGENTMHCTEVSLRFLGESGFKDIGIDPDDAGLKENNIILSKLGKKLDLSSEESKNLLSLE